MMDTYQIYTGMWACDLIGSKDISDDQKSIMIEQIQNGIDAVKTELSAEFIIQEFRGDGYLIIFAAENARSILLAFAKSICQYFIMQIEDKIIDEKFRLRTYIDFGDVTICGNNKKVVGCDVDSFCQLVDNKFSSPFIVKEKYNSVLIASKHWTEELESEKTFAETYIDKNNYYKCEYAIKNLLMKINFKNSTGEDEKTLDNIVEKAAKKYCIKKFRLSCKCNWEISGNGSDDNIYNFFVYLSDEIYNKFGENKNKYVLIFLDLTNIEDSLFFSEHMEDITDKININKEFRSYLIWSDICLDRFRRTERFKERQKFYKKIPMTDQMRVYYEDYADDKLYDKRKIIGYSEVKDTRIYLHSFDYCVQKSIASTHDAFNMPKHLTCQLEIALMLFDSVIIHSAEIIRNEIVYKILDNYRKLICDGSISLLFSSKVNNLERDFYSYIQEKIQEYGMSEYGKEEAGSLKDAIDNDNYNNALELIKLCPYLLKRDIDGTVTLEILVTKDLHDINDTPILSESHLSNSDLLKKNYSIRQLLSIKYIGVGLCYVLEKELQDEIINLIDRHLNGVLSASIVKCVLEDKIPQGTKEKYRKWYQALINRINFLYAQVNTGNNIYMEYLPEKLKNGIFDISAFYSLFTDYVDVDGLIGPERILLIRSKKNKWNEFRLHYLAYKAKEKEMYSCGFYHYISKQDDKNLNDLKKIIERIVKE